MKEANPGISDINIVKYCTDDDVWLEEASEFCLIKLKRQMCGNLGGKKSFFKMNFKNEMVYSSGQH